MISGLSRVRLAGAIVNAVAHRDYCLTGLRIEVHLFDDRLEIWGPGELVGGRGVVADLHGGGEDDGIRS